MGVVHRIHSISGHILAGHLHCGRYHVHRRSHDVIVFYGILSSIVPAFTSVKYLVVG